MTIRVLLVDGNPFIREGIKVALQSAQDIHVVGECDGGGSALEPILALSPHVVVIDVPAAGSAGIKAIQRIKAHRPGIQILVLAPGADVKLFRRVAAAGAAGFELKDISPTSLAGAVRAVHAGKPMLNPEIARQLAGALSGNEAKPTQHLHGLTPRQIDILAKVAQGLTDKEIAARLYLSESTVKSHLRTVYQILRLRNRAQAVAFALERGLLQAPCAE